MTSPDKQHPSTGSHERNDPNDDSCDGTTRKDHVGYDRIYHCTALVRPAVVVVISVLCSTLIAITRNIGLVCRDIEARYIVSEGIRRDVDDIGAGIVRFLCVSVKIGNVLDLDRCVTAFDGICGRLCDRVACMS